MKEAKRLAKGNYIKIFQLVILAIFAFSGFLLLGVGAMVTLPVAHVALLCLRSMQELTILIHSKNYM